MIPLIYGEPGEESVIKKIGGSAEVKRHLEDMGFTAGASVTLVSTVGGNVIVKVKESRVGLDRDLAKRVMI